MIRLLLVFLLLWTGFSLPARAVLRQHHETPGVLRYHSHYSLQDSAGRAWQVLLFPDNGRYYLRLVGFPNFAAFRHPDPLEIITANGDILVARDVFAATAPASNVGQYDLSPLLPKIPERGSLKLIPSLQIPRDFSLTVPESIALEWHWLAREKL